MFVLALRFLFFSQEQKQRCKNELFRVLVKPKLIFYDFLVTPYRSLLFLVSRDTFCDRQFARLILVVSKHTHRTNTTESVFVVRQKTTERRHISSVIYIIYHTLYIEIGIPKG